MKKSKRIRVKIRKAKRAALADMENTMSLGKDVLYDMLNEGLYNPYSHLDIKSSETMEQ
tara:strand:+ start:2614 stop:2790 length:177 start_codon:yes stop_codon:yes gene_type:complete